MFVSEAATILHADLDAFYASVEKRDDSRLHRRPVIVGAGVVLAASYEAKRCGVGTAMGVERARRLCPYATVVPPRISAYVEASRAVFAVFEQTAPVVEALSIDEAFLDVRGLERISGTPLQIAQRLRDQVLEQVGLPITVGISATKFLAKVASACAKPDGLHLVGPGSELEFLHPLPIERLWGVGKVTARKLHGRGISTVGELAELDQRALVEVVGRAAARHLHALAHNQDPRPVRGRARRRSIGAQRALGRRERPPDEIGAALIGLVDRVMRRLRAAGRACRTVVLRLRFADFSRATRSHTLAEPATRTDAVLLVALELLRGAWRAITARGITLIGISLSGLVDERNLQLSLMPDRSRQLDQAIDSVRERYGAAILTRASLVGREAGVTVPMLPDT